MGCFPNQERLKGEPVGYYYANLVIKDIGSCLHNRVYGEGLVAVSGQDFRHTAIQLCKKLSSEIRFYKVWPVLAKFNAFQCMNVPRSFDEEVLEDGDEVEFERTANVIFDLKDTKKIDYRRFNALVVRATRKISPGDELFVNYDLSYIFHISVDRNSHILKNFSFHFKFTVSKSR